MGFEMGLREWEVHLGSLEKGSNAHVALYEAKSEHEALTMALIDYPDCWVDWTSDVTGRKGVEWEERGARS